jgi:pimeloyl-ACP methyl ester carboxylesterase
MALPSTPERIDHLVWKRTSVDGRTASFGVAGSGLPVVFLHGWGLSEHSYRRPLRRLVAMGCRVWAPALPGFGGTAHLPRGETSFAGYAGWVDGFMDAVGIDGPALVVGHSFGGGVAITVADRFSERVRELVLVNSVGGSTWSVTGRRVRSMAKRPLWDWGLHLPGDVLPLPQLTRVLPVFLEDALPNALRNPRAVWQAAQLARKADLTAELEDLKARKLPVVALWSRRDQIIPRASFDALCAAVGTPGVVVEGNHSWLLADPDAFAAVMKQPVDEARTAWELEARPPRAGIVARLLGRRALG